MRQVQKDRTEKALPRKHQPIVALLACWLMEGLITVQVADTYWADDFECEMESRIKLHDSFLIATMVTW